MYLARYIGLGIAGAAATSIAMASDEKAKSDDRSAKAMFDPEALERGAKALREINKSPFAKQVIKISRQPHIRDHVARPHMRAPFTRFRVI